MITSRKMNWSRIVALGASLLLGFVASIASAELVGTTTYYHNDFSGSPIAATNEAGSPLWQTDYMPYGKKFGQDNSSTSNKVWYTGHIEDSSTGLVYMEARYYDPDVGRFMGVDPVGFVEANPQSFNRFAYGNNNPYRFTDPNGEHAIIVLMLVGFAAEMLPAAPNAAGDDSIQPMFDSPALVAAGGSAAIKAGSKLLVRSEAVAKGAGKEIGILRDAAKGKGNFGLGSGTRAEAEKLGKAWVGDGYEVASDGKTLVSKDGLKQYRPPSYKPRLNKTQANFEQRFPGQQSNRWQSNGHLDITD